MFKIIEIIEEQFYHNGDWNINEKKNKNNDFGSFEIQELNSNEYKLVEIKKHSYPDRKFPQVTIVHQTFVFQKVPINIIRNI